MRHPELVAGPQGATVPAPGDERFMGALLVEAGRLSGDEVVRILHLQQSEGLRFGEAGMRLGLLQQQDIDLAIARQYDYTCLDRGDARIGPEVVAAFQPSGRTIEQLRTLRSRLLLCWFDPGKQQTAVAVVSAQPKEGRSFIAANLAVAFAQLGKRTLLVDADFRTGCQARLFKLDGRAGLSTLLTQRSGGSGPVRIEALPNLSVLPTGPVPPNPQELLSRPTFGQVMAGFREGFEAIVVDTPPSRQFGDAQNVAALAGAALLVARRHRSTAHGLAELSRSMSHSGAVMLGSVLGDF